MSGSFLDLGGFQWGVVDKLDPGPQASEPHRSFRRVGDDQKLVLDQLGEQLAGTSVPVGFPLNHLQGKNFRGTGFNMIFRPKPFTPVNGMPPNTADGTSDNVLQVNLTEEKWTFPKSLGEIPNRGFGLQGDIMLTGMPYIQTVKDLSNELSGLGDKNPGTDIHFEPGVFLWVPQVKVDGGLQQTAPTLVRMASIPHGTTVNAQGLAPLRGPGPNGGSQGPPDIHDLDTRPFDIGKPGQRHFFISMQADKRNELRFPPDLQNFVKKGTITKDIILNPNRVLKNVIAGLDIKETITFEVSTGPPTDQLTGGGVSNIAFLMGAKNPEVKTEVKAATKTVVTETPTTGNPNANADASFMSSKFWIEFVDYKVDIPKLVANEKRVVKAKVPAGAPVPRFQVTAPAGGFLDKKDFVIRGVQVQYSQVVHLDFGVKGFVLTWPHVSVATLVPTEPVDVALK